MIELASWSTAVGDWVEPEPLDDEPPDEAFEELELLPHALNEAPASTSAAATAPVTRLELIWG
jgi:hypothetical protein